MTPRLPNLRYEKKFIAERLTLAELLARVRLHPAAFREVYPPRTVNNLYLDSPTRRDYHDHINRSANRSKTRALRALMPSPTHCRFVWPGFRNTSLEPRACER